MIEIEASQIKLGGGKVLLGDLVRYLSENRVYSIVWVNNDLYSHLSKYANDYVTIKETTFVFSLIRYLFRKRINTLFFCSIPPLRKSVNSIVYFHNMYYALSRDEIMKIYHDRKYRTLIKVIVYKLWIYFTKTNASWAAQTFQVREKLKLVYGVDAMLMPFYYLNKLPTVNVKEFDFCYVAYPYAHKNHMLLLDAMEDLAARCKCTLALTVPDNSSVAERIRMINSKFGRNVIYNLGIINRDEVADLYEKSACLVFPSSLETLGLPLLEANACGLKIICGDYPYVHDVIENPIIFDTRDYKNMANVMELFLIGYFDGVVQIPKVDNCLDDLINYLNGTIKK